MNGLKQANVPDESTLPDLDKDKIFLHYNDGYAGIAPAGSFAPNGFGLYDMAGNVWERCSDWYDENYYKYSPQEDPKGPPTGIKRVLRGGGYWFHRNNLRLAYRCGTPLDRAGDNDGFRVVMEIKYEFPLNIYIRRRFPAFYFYHLPSIDNVSFGVIGLFNHINS